MICRTSDVWDELERIGCSSYVPKGGDEWIAVLYEDNRRLWEIRSLEETHLGRVLPGPRECETKTAKEIVEESAYARSLDGEREAILKRQGAMRQDEDGWAWTWASWLEPDQPEPRVKKVRCAHVITRGPWKGDICTRYAILNSSVCKVHQSDVRPNGGCSALNNKGGLCGVGAVRFEVVCGVHTEAQGERSESTALELLKRRSYAPGSLLLLERWEAIQSSKYQSSSKPRRYSHSA